MENYFLNMELFWPASIWRLSHAEIFQGGKQKNPKDYNFQNTSLGLFRSDYFYCCDSQRIKQVEFNTIASSFGALSARLVLAQKLVMIHSGQKCLPRVANVSEGGNEEWRRATPTSISIFVLILIIYIWSFYHHWLQNAKTSTLKLAGFLISYIVYGGKGADSAHFGKHSLTLPHFHSRSTNSMSYESWHI